MRPEAIDEVGGQFKTVLTTDIRTCFLCSSSGRQVQLDLRWCYECHLGWSTSPFDMSIYNRNYLNEYISRSKDRMSERLNSARIKEVLRYDTNSTLVDYGCGAGAFVEKAVNHFSCCGMDVNRDALEYCKLRIKDATFVWAPWGMPPYPLQASVVTFFDSLEHVPSPVSLLLDCEASVLVVSSPIFTSVEHVRWSKHFKPLEHLWYFTTKSLVELMRRTGYKAIRASSFESDIGREDIVTFGFVRDEKAND